MQLVEPQSQLIPGIVSVEKKKPSISGVQRRMGLAYDKLVMAAEERESSLSPKTIRTLGKLVLEFEQVNENLASIQAQIRQDIREKKRIFDEEKKLVKEEKDELTTLRAGLFETRAKIAAFSAVVAGKALLEGRFGDALQPAGVAVGAMLPEIVNLASTLVLGRLALGRGAGVAAGAMRRGGGMRMPGGLGMLGLGAAATVPFAMAGSASAADERRRELVKKQTESAPISTEDVERFQSILTRFDAIVSNMGGAAAEKEEPKKAEGEGKDGDGDPTPPPGPGGGSVTPINFSEDKMVAMSQAAKEIGLPPETLAGIIQAESGGNPQRQNSIGRTGLIQMGPNETASFGVKFEDYKKMTFNQQLDLVVRYFKQRGFKPGMTDLQAYKTVHGGNPYAPNTADANGVTTEGFFKSNVEPAIRSFRGKFDNIRLPESEQPVQPQVSRPQIPPVQPEEPVTPSRGGDGQDLGPQSMNIIQIPGGTNVAKPSGSKPAPSSTNVAFNIGYESVDKLYCQSLLGVFG